MRKIILSVFLICYSLICMANEPSISEVRLKLHKATSNEKACRELIAELGPYNERNNALFTGYRGGANMIMAKHVFNPFSKLSYFNKGKSMLEKAIQAEGKNVELRFLRYSIQTNVPVFLGYKSHLKNDYDFLKQAIPAIKDSNLKKIITSYLQQNIPE
ncbi:MAG: hypothetical protein WKF68_08855 [Daejeonella sp.]